MARPLVEDALWERVRPILPPPKPRRFRFPGRKPVDGLKARTGLLLVLKTGIPREDLPVEMGCGFGMTCWRGPHEWHHAGVWDCLHTLLLAEWLGADRIDWSRAVLDSSGVRSPGSRDGHGPNVNFRPKTFASEFFKDFRVPGR
jgi:transposase